MHTLTVQLFFLCMLRAFLPYVSADDFSIPSTWESSSFTDSRDNRINVARGAMAQILTNISDDSTGIKNMDMWQAAPLLSHMAMAELAIGSTKWKDDITRVLAGRAQRSTGYAVDSPTVNDPIMAWSLACVYAYRAYRDQSLLRLAEQGWTNASAYFVTESQAAARSHPTHDGQISSSCKGHTTAGAVLYSRDRANTLVIPSVVGQFAALSAHLAEETSNSTYLQAATLSANFFYNVLSDAGSGVIYHSVTLQDCSMSQDPQADDAGIAIHAWSVMADVAKDDRWRDAALRALLASTKASWMGQNGIVHSPLGTDADDNVQVTKGYYIGSLYEPWVRNSNNASVSNFVSALVATQYNALQTQASKNGSNYYNANWSGSGIDYWTRGGVMASTPVLAVALAPVSNSSTSSPSGPPNSTTTDESNKSQTRHTPIAAIVGGTVGGLVFIALLVLAIILLRRAAARRSERRGGYLDAQLEKSPVDRNATYVAPRRPVQMVEQPQSSDDRAGSNVPVADIVELVYKRLQAERPPYEEATNTTSLPPSGASSDSNPNPFMSPPDTRPLPVPATPGLPPYAPSDRVNAVRTNTAVFRKT